MTEFGAESPGHVAEIGGLPVRYYDSGRHEVQGVQLTVHGSSC